MLPDPTGTGSVPPGLASRREETDARADSVVSAITGQAQEQMGLLTALVNNAGAVGEQAHIAEQHEDALNRLTQVNVAGPMLCAKHAVLAMSTAQAARADRS